MDVLFKSTCGETLPPDLPTDVQAKHGQACLRIVSAAYKLSMYLSVGTRVWLVLPEKRSIEAYAPAQMPRRYFVGDSLREPELFPEFGLALDKIFRTPSTSS